MRQSRTQLDATARSRGFQYNASQIAKYEKLGGTPQLDNEYTVYGEIVEGMEVIDKIAAVATNSADRPTKDVKMTVTVVN